LQTGYETNNLFSAAKDARRYQPLQEVLCKI